MELAPAGRRDRARSRWASPMSRARRPPGATRPAAASEGLFEVLDGAHGDQAGASWERRFGAGVEDGKAGEVEGASDFAQEGGFFAVALDEGELEVGRPVLDGQAGKAGAAAEIEEILPGVARSRGGGRRRATRRNGARPSPRACAGR